MGPNAVKYVAHAGIVNGINHSVLSSLAIGPAIAPQILLAVEASLSTNALTKLAIYEGNPYSSP